MSHFAANVTNDNIFLEIHSSVEELTIVRLEARLGVFEPLKGAERICLKLWLHDLAQKIPIGVGLLGFNLIAYIMIINLIYQFNMENHKRLWGFGLWGIGVLG